MKKSSKLYFGYLVILILSVIIIIVGLIDNELSTTDAFVKTLSISRAPTADEIEFHNVKFFITLGIKILAVIVLAWLATIGWETRLFRKK